MRLYTRCGLSVSLFILFLSLSVQPFQTVTAGPVAQTTQLSPLLITTPTPTSSVNPLLPTVTPTPGPNLGSSGPDLPTGHSGEQWAGAYTVKPGDTLLTVSLEIGVDVGDMPCVIAPDFRPEQPLVIGDTYSIPANRFVCHEVQPAETLASIAAQYGIVPAAIRLEAWNRLQGVPNDDVWLVEGAFLRVPVLEAVGSGEGGFLAFMLNQPVDVSPYVAYSVGGPRAAEPAVPVPENWPFGSGNFAWPVYGWMSQGYRNDHRAIDIAAPAGTQVTAADRGVVIRAGWNNQGYGLFVIIDHNIDYITLYSHLDEVFVEEGEVVAQGQVIGVVGSTGNSTGPHLHFELRDFGRRANPLQYLMR